MRIVTLGADRAKSMPPCSVCGRAKVDQQRLAIGPDGRLIHAACKEAAR